MKYLIIALLIISGLHSGQAQTPDNIKITTEKGKTKFKVDDSGVLEINVSPKDLDKFKSRGSLGYGDFGAKGNGKTDDIDAIAATHAVANQFGIPVKADDDAKYYIGGKERTVIIMTDTDFGTAEFTIDDTNVENRQAPIFQVTSTLESFPLEGISTLRRNQTKIDANLPSSCLITVTDSNVKRYIRFGPNQNNGSSQTDIFIVDKDGNVDKNTPIIWEFNQITEINALPMDETTLTIKGGIFTTIANQAESKYTYYSRGLAIKRSNVLVEGLEHRVTGEGEHGAPYGGFIIARDCGNVTVRNTILTGHKTYRTIGSAGVPVSMGTYDISINRALNVSFINCSQTNDINDRTYWGIMGSNYSKNLMYDSCVFSRFDAHMGVANATIRNSTMGHMGINAIGTGTLLIENSTIRGRTLVNLRSDYGSTWQGDFIIRNCTFIPNNGQEVSKVSLIGGHNSGQHDFGYTCYMPETVTIEKLFINDENHTEDYEGPTIFADLNPDMTDDSYQQKFPYVITRELNLKLYHLSSRSGKPLRLSDNMYMFKDVEITTSEP